jgi:demethylmenaquinone methyltransferase/2-methoxy-6-polyprenyl-1,4-benzoquinol methylase
MLREARARLAKVDLYNRITLLEGDGFQLPFQSASLSAVFLSFTLELFDTPEIPLVLEECWRVLTSAGRLGVVSMLKTEPPNPMIRLYEWFHAHLPAYVDKRETRSMWGLPVEVVLAMKA